MSCGLIVYLDHLQGTDESSSLSIICFTLLLHRIGNFMGLVAA
jgi:hypothetical protein